MVSTLLFKPDPNKLEGCYLASELTKGTISSKTYLASSNYCLVIVLRLRH